MAKFVALAAALLLLSVTGLDAQADPVLEPEGRPATVVGILKFEHGFGPPGWGEDRKHDARISYWVLELPKAINTHCTPERPEWASRDCAPTKRMKLFFSSSPSVDELTMERHARKMQGRQLLVTGILHRSETAGEITPIYMDVSEIELATTQNLH